MKKLLVIILLGMVTSLSHGQSTPKASNRYGKPSESEKTLSADEMRSIARKYGVEKNVTITSLPENQPLGASGRSVVRFTKENFEALMKQVSFNERKAAVHSQFFRDVQKLSSGRELVALKKDYLKKYPEYFKDNPTFSKEVIQMQESMADEIILNTPGYRKNHPQPR